MSDGTSGLTIVEGYVKPDLGSTPYALPLDPFTSDLRPYVNFNPDGSIRHAGVMAVGFIWAQIDQGALVLIGEGQFDSQTGEFLSWVDWVDGEYQVQPRPPLPRSFDRTTLKVEEEAILVDLPPSDVSFTGPVSGSFRHDGGDLEIGWIVPGEYAVVIRSFPYLTLRVVFTVEPA